MTGRQSSSRRPTAVASSTDSPVLDLDSSSLYTATPYPTEDDTPTHDHYDGRVVHVRFDVQSYPGVVTGGVGGWGGGVAFYPADDG